MWDTAYKPKKTDAIFYVSKYSLKRQLDTACRRAKVPRIRIHDLRHSHASLLINQGEDYLVVKERLGHDIHYNNNLITYSHLYPSKQKTLANKLDDLF